MPRRSQWAGNDTMWEYAATLARGGMTYRDVEAKLSESEQRKRFGLLAVPHADTIRNNVHRLGLLDPGRPRSALPPAELESHHRGLTYLGLALREQVRPTPQRSRRIPVASRELMGAHRWFGFDSGRLYTPEPQSREEFEVDEEWTEQLTDPRMLSHYGYFVEHLESTAAGREVAESLVAVFNFAERCTAAVQGLQLLDDEPIEERFVGEPDDTSAPSARNVVEAPYRGEPGVQAENGSAGGRRRARGRSPNIETGAGAVDNLRNRPERDELRKSWTGAEQAAEKLKRSLRPASLVRRIVQDGQCGICRLNTADCGGI